MEKGETFLSLKTLIIYSFKINRNMHGYIYIFDIYEKKIAFQNCIIASWKYYIESPQVFWRKQPNCLVLTRRDFSMRIEKVLNLIYTQA